MICVDASVVAKLFLREEYSDRARIIYFAALQDAEPIVAPPLLRFELTNIVRKQMRGERALTLDEAGQLLANFLALLIEIHSPPGLHQWALTIADACGLPATYDAHYLALAQEMDCEFWTGDVRLLRQVQPRLPFVRWLGDDAAPTAP